LGTNSFKKNYRIVSFDIVPLRLGREEVNANMIASICPSIDMALSLYGIKQPKGGSSKAKVEIYMNLNFHGYSGFD
jgi:hypothetical protein